MATATFHFHAELNDFLPEARRERPFAYAFKPPQSVKHLIEAAGVPHPEVALILGNGAPVDFHYAVQDGDQIAVYPAPAVMAAAPLLRPPLHRPVRFLLDIHLGQLARYLRLLGFDARYPDHNHDDAGLARLAHDDDRVLLTRDRGLLKRRLVTHGYCLRTMDPRAQVTAVLRRYDLYSDIRELTRCLRCNGTLQPVNKAAVLHLLEPKTKLYYDVFQQCQACGQVYWQGSHTPQIQAFLDGVRQEAGQMRRGAVGEAHTLTPFVG